MADKPLRRFEAQLTIKTVSAFKHDAGLFGKSWDIWCKKEYNSIKPYDPPPNLPTATPQDTLWGDFKTKVLPSLAYSSESYLYYREQSDLCLNLEYAKTTWNLDRPPRWKEGFDIAQPLDNVLIEEYEKGWFFKKSFHRILQIERNGTVIFREKNLADAKKGKEEINEERQHLSDHADKDEKTTIGSILSWIFGCLFAFIGIVSIFSEPIPGLIFLAIGAVLLPPVNKLFESKCKFHLSKGIKAFLIIGLLVLVGMIDNISKTEQENTSPSSKITQKQYENVTKVKKDINKRNEGIKTETTKQQKVDEQEAYLQRLQKYPPDSIGKVNYVKKSGNVKYPVKERDTAVNCLNGKPIKMPADLKQFLFSGCEYINLSNWQGKYETVKYDETWTYELFNTLNGRPMSRVEVYWQNRNFILEIGYYPDGYINYIRDRIYYENSVKSEY